MFLNQTTLKKEISFEGIGVHSGLVAKMTLKPANVNTGIVFSHPKFPNEPFIIGKVLPEVAMQATVLKQKSWMLSTIEHLMAAIVLTGVDNVLVEIDGYEVPILDGSALPFVQAIQSVGLNELQSPKKYITPKQVLRFDGTGGRSIEIKPTQTLGGQFNYELKIDYVAEFSKKLIGSDRFKCVLGMEYFINEIAPARTFGFLEDLPQVRQYCLAKGTSLGNTVVLGEDGFLNELRFEDECIRHKVLDLLGDLGLLGHQLIGQVNACKTGHSFNREVIAHYISNPELWQII